MNDLGMKAVVAALVLASTMPASADMIDDCEQLADPQRSITGCTALIQSAGSSDAERFAAFFNRANAYRQLDQTQRSIQDYDEAIRIGHPSLAYRAYSGRGSAYGVLGQIERAIQDYDQALRLNPRDAQTFHYRGVMHFELGRYRTAINDFSEAIRISPDYAFAYLDRGTAYAELGEHARAIEDFASANRLVPGLAPAR